MDKHSYEFQIAQEIIDISSIILKDIEEQYNKKEGEMLISAVCLQLVDDFPNSNIEQSIKELFKVFNEPIDADTIINLDKKFCNSKNEELKEIYLKYPIHDAIHDKDWSKQNISRYISSLRKISTYFKKITEDDVCKFLIAKNTMDKMILDIRKVHELISLKNIKGIKRIIQMKEIKKADKSLEEFKNIWRFYSNIVYKYITEDEKRRYELLLGERLINA